MTKEQQIQILKVQILNAKQIQWNASQMRRASGVFAAQRELETLYRKLDALTK